MIIIKIVTVNVIIVKLLFQGYKKLVQDHLVGIPIRKLLLTMVTVGKLIFAFQVQEQH